jgi:hypothetical protein
MKESHRLPLLPPILCCPSLSVLLAIDIVGTKILVLSTDMLYLEQVTSAARQKWRYLNRMHDSPGVLRLCKLFPGYFGHFLRRDELRSESHLAASLVFIRFSSQTTGTPYRIRF